MTGGCDGKDERLDPDRASQAVLRISDLPDGFTAFDRGEIESRDVAPGPREDPARFGRQGGWKTRFRRVGAPGTRGPLVVESRVDVFSDSDGAGDELAAYRSEYEAALAGVDAASQLDDPDLGEAAVAFTFVQRGLTDAHYFAIAFRLENAVASLLVSGLKGRLSLREVVALGRKQLARIQAEL